MSQASFLLCDWTWLILSWFVDTFWAKKLYPTYSDITSWVNAHHIWSLISVRMSCAPKYRDSGLVRRWYDLQSMKNSSAPCCDTIIEHTSQQFLWTQPAFQSNTRSSTLWVVCAREKQDHHQKPPPQLAERQSSASSTEQTSERTISASAGGSQGTPSWWWILKLLFLWDSCAPTNRILCERENGAALPSQISELQLPDSRCKSFEHIDCTVYASLNVINRYT